MYKIYINKQGETGRPKQVLNSTELDRIDVRASQRVSVHWHGKPEKVREFEIEF